MFVLFAYNAVSFTIANRMAHSSVLMTEEARDTQLL